MHTHNDDRRANAQGTFKTELQLIISFKQSNSNLLVWFFFFSKTMIKIIKNYAHYIAGDKLQKQNIHLIPIPSN